jgi:hypothetical protein
MDAAAQYAMAYALTTSAGIRALLPLALVSIAAHFGYVHPPEGFAWLGSTPVTAVLIGVALAEMFADKIPLLDHALHFVQIAVKPAAAAILVAGTAHPQNHDVLVTLIVLGALNALGVHAFTSAVRVGSTMTTGGLANPVASTVEDTAAVGTTVLAFFAPFIAAALALALVVLLVRVVRGTFRRRAAIK